MMSNKPITIVPLATRTRDLRQVFARLPVPFDLIQVCSAFVVMLTFMSELLLPDGCLTRGPLTATAWTLVMGGFGLLPWVRGPIIARSSGAWYVTGRLLLGMVAYWLARRLHLSPYLFYIVVMEALLLDRRLGIATAAWTVLGFAAITFWRSGFGQTGTYLDLLLWMVGLTFLGGTTLVMIGAQEERARSEQLVHELSEAHEHMRRYAEQVHDLATTEERNRLAREIHDSLGHYLTVINIQLEKAQALRERDDERANVAVTDAKRLASEALADVRRSVAALRPQALTHLPLASVIQQQIADVCAEGDLDVSLHVEGNAQRASQAADFTLYRVVQEGLTNICKHAGATRAVITLRYGHAATELTIADNGRGMTEASDTSGGIGLTGLRERAMLLGGTLDIGSEAGRGTVLRIVIPCRSQP